METVGRGNNVNIMSWAKQLGVIGWYPGDSVPWCGLFKGICAYRAGWLKLPASSLLSSLWWRKWGVPIPVEDAYKQIGI